MSSTSTKELTHLQRRYNIIKSKIDGLNDSLQKLNLKCYIKQSLLDIRNDIIKLKEKQECLSIANNNVLSQIYESSKQLQNYQSQHIIVDILYLDESFCIVNKPANICIDGDEDITLEKLTLNTLKTDIKIRHCHQLDRATSGILIYGLTRKAAGSVSTLFQNRNVIKIYYGIVYGHVELDHFLIDFPLSKSPNDRIREMIGNNRYHGRAAITECFVEKRGFLKELPVSLVKVHLHTGRRHQIRIHLSKCAHPIIGDPTYCDNINVLKSIKFDTMYLDSHQMILDFKKDNKIINVSTNSKYIFDSLIETIDDESDCKQQESEKKMDVLLFPEPHSFDTYHYSMIIPFVIDNNNDVNDIKILIKKCNKLDMINYKNKKPRSQVLKTLCWNFLCEARLEKGHCDAAQTISQVLLDKMPQFASYLMNKSQFASNRFKINYKDQYEDEYKNQQLNIKYLAHHLASNIRRGSMYHCTILCSPYVIFMVPFTNNIMNDSIINENKDMIWCSLNELSDDILCYSPLHLIDINDIKLQMDPLLHVVLSNDCISSIKWIKQQRNERLILNMSKSVWIDKYQMNMNKKQIDNEPIRVLKDIEIYLGNIKAAKNTKRLKELNITHIIDCTAKCKQCIINNGFTRLCIPVQDLLNDNIIKYMDECLQFIDNALNNNKTVLVHCWLGASRSVSIIIGYLMKYHNIKLKNSLEYIAKIRGTFARPNTSFILQLIEMEKKLFGCNSFQITPKQFKRYQRKINKLNNNN